MRTLLITSAVVAVALVSAGCKPEPEDPTVVGPPSTANIQPGTPPKGGGKGGAIAPMANVEGKKAAHAQKAKAEEEAKKGAGK